MILDCAPRKIETPAARIRQSSGAGIVCSDEVSSHGVRLRAGARNSDTLEIITRDHIARRSSGAINRVAGRAAENLNSGVVRKGRGAVKICADEILLNLIHLGADGADADARADVAADDVGRGSGGTTNGVGVRTPKYSDALKLIADSHSSGGIEAFNVAVAGHWAKAA